MSVLSNAPQTPQPNSQLPTNAPVGNNTPAYTTDTLTTYNTSTDYTTDTIDGIRGAIALFIKGIMTLGTFIKETITMASPVFILVLTYFMDVFIIFAILALIVFVIIYLVDKNATKKKDDDLDILTSTTNYINVNFINPDLDLDPATLSIPMIIYRNIVKYFIQIPSISAYKAGDKKTRETEALGRCNNIINNREDTDDRNCINLIKKKKELGWGNNPLDYKLYKNNKYYVPNCTARGFQKEELRKCQDTDSITHYSCYF